jgi:hypothetical protein
MNRPRIDRPEVGSQFVIRRLLPDGLYAYDVATSFTDGEKIPRAYFSDGTIGKWNTASNKLCGIHEWSVYFDYPLPELNKTDQISYAKSMRGHHINDKIITPDHVRLCAFKVELESDMAFARMLSWSVGYDNQDSLADGYKGLSEHYLEDMSDINSAFCLTRERYCVDPKCLPKEISNGDIVICDDFEFSDKGKILNLNSARFPTDKPAGQCFTAVFPSRRISLPRPGQPHINRLSLTPVGEFLHRLEIAKRSEEPEVALIIAIPPEDKSQNGESIFAIISRRGPAFYVDAYFGHIFEEILNEPPPPGIHIAEEPNSWSYTTYEGEHEAGVDVNIRAASRDDLNQFNHDLQSLGIAIKTHIDDYLDEVDQAFLNATKPMTNQEIAALLLDWPTAEVTHEPILQPTKK